MSEEAKRDYEAIIRIEGVALPIGELRAIFASVVAKLNKDAPITFKLIDVKELQA